MSLAVAFDLLEEKWDCFVGVVQDCGHIHAGRQAQIFAGQASYGSSLDLS